MTLQPLTEQLRLFEAQKGKPAHVEGFTRDDRVAWKDAHGLRHTGRVLAALPQKHCLTIRDDRGAFGIVNLYPALTPIERL